MDLRARSDILDLHQSRGFKHEFPSRAGELGFTAEQAGRGSRPGGVSLQCEVSYEARDLVPSFLHSSLVLVNDTFQARGASVLDWNCHAGDRECSVEWVVK